MTVAILTQELIDSMGVHSAHEIGIIWDENTPSFGVRVSRSGKASYIARCTSLAGRQMVTLGSVESISLIEARQRAIKLRRIGSDVVETPRSAVRDTRNRPIQTGVRPATEIAEALASSISDGIVYALSPLRDSLENALRTTPSIAPVLKQSYNESTVRDLVDAYIERHALKRLKTGEHIARYLTTNLRPLFTRRLSSFTVEDAERLHRDIGKRAPIMANRVIQYMKSAWNKGVKWGLCAGPNTFSDVTFFSETIRNRALSVEETKRLLAVLDRYASRNVRDFVRLALFTGVRKARILSMRWDDVDLQGQIWNVPPIKGEEPQMVLLGDEELQILKSRKRSSVWVFSAKSNSGHLTCPDDSWKKIVERAGLKGVRIHDLRRSLASAMAESNVNVAIIQSALNHKTMQTTLKVYARASKRAELEARKLVQRQWLNK